MLPSEKILVPPTVVDGRDIGRIVEKRDGSGYTESWTPKFGWQKGGVTFDEFLHPMCYPVPSSHPCHSDRRRRLKFP
jgi:hypothetical protein